MENTFSRYKNKNTIVHKIDPITKLILFLFIVISTFIAQSPETLLIVFCFIFFVSILSKTKIKSYFNILFFILPFFIIMFLLYLIPEDNMIDSLIIVSYMSLRLYIFILLSIIYTSSTKEIDIADSINWLISPLRFLKIPTYDISLMITLAIRFIPLLFLDVKKIMIAQTSRGVNVFNGNFIIKIKGLFYSFIPMFFLSMKRSDDFAKAITIRKYQVGKKRTKYKKNKFAFIEIISFLFILALFIIVILLNKDIIKGEWF